MKCTRPTKFSPNGQYLSCGQCMPCRITRRTEWLTKLELEYKTWNSGIFVTLTYAPEHLPDFEHFDGGNLVKEDAQKFIKRFKRNYQYKYGDRVIRFFLVGEYGDKSQRAHYHVIIYNVDPLASQNIVQKSWKLGHSMVDVIHTNRLRYVLGYTIKKMTNEKDFPDGQTPEFTLMSRKPALGSYALPRIYKILKRRDHVVTSHLTGLQKWHLYNDGLMESKTEFNGWFKIGKRNAKLDRNMMVQLSKMFYPKYDYLGDTIDSRYTLLPKQYRSKQDLLHDISKNVMIKEMLNGKRHETQKKADKLKRTHSEKRRL